MNVKRFTLSTVTIAAFVVAFWFVMRPQQQLENQPLHSTMEAVEALSALLMAVFLLGRKEEGADKLILPALGFLGMGILNSAHAASWPGDQFVFLKAAANLAGGLGFALVWLPAPYRAASYEARLLWTVVAGSLTLCIWAFLFPISLPVMVLKRDFTTFAVTINLLAGMLFIAGTLRFTRDLYHSNKVEDLLFSLIGLFFGLSGLTFKYSMLWSEAWWFWHVLRLMASLLVLGLLVQRYLQTVTTLKSSLFERKQDEKILRESREDLNRAQAVAQTGSWRLHVRRNELLWSDETYRIFRISKETPLTYEKFLSAVHPDDRELVDNSWKAALRGEPYDIEHRIVVEGRIKWVREKAELEFDERGALLGGFGTVQDITDHKRYEDELKQLSYQNKLFLESAGDGIWGVDTQGIVTFMNKAGASMLGYEPNELIGTHSHAQWHQPRPDGTPYPSEECPIYASYKDGASHFGEEVFWRKDGTSFPIDFTSRPLFVKDKIVGAVITFKDITERKRAEEERERLLADLARSNKELEQFAYVASHDLQEPLRMVASYVQLLERKYHGNLDEKADSYIHFAVDGARRMQKLIEGLLAYSRITRRGAEFGPVYTNAVFAGAVSNLTAAIKESRAVVTKDDLPAVSGDETQLIQLFQNLIGNAIKFRKPDTPPLVHVSVKREGKEWVFSVRDNGIGIESEYYERIFLIFQRLHTREHYPGTGIGLALCKRIVERHHGRIWVESSPGEGTTFFFTIPVYRGEGKRP